MNRNIHIKLLFAFSFSLILTISFAQSKKTVILINSVPYNVVLSPDGEIEQVNSEAKNYMRGYIKSKEEFIFESEVASSDILEGTSVRSERQLLVFEDGYATMNESNTAILDKIADNYVPGKSEKLLISAFKPSESAGKTLYENRLSTIKTYLELNGVPSNAISTEIVVSAALKDQVSITFVQE